MGISGQANKVGLRKRGSSLHFTDYGLPDILLLVLYSLR
jgi:hypothetical protein